MLRGKEATECCICVGSVIQINLLLIGESGVGKSTWINAIANYCKFTSLKKAMKADGFFPIDYDLQLTHTETKEKMCVSSEGKAVHAERPAAKVGESVTENPNEYVFQHENFQIHLIDTPGLNDTRDRGTSDHAKDKERVKNILRLLSSYDEIHAICILVKASETRLSDALTYTITEILKYLDKDACNNIIFIFTYASSTSFESDTTQSLIEKFLKENKLDIPLPPDKQTIYSFDEGPVNYLVQCNNNIPQTEDDEDDAQRNWRRSTRSMKEMLRYVCGLKPHSLARIHEIFNTEQTIGVLSKLVLENVMCAVKDVVELESKKRDLERMKTQISNDPHSYAQQHLKELLTVTQRKVVHRSLDCTNVVCESSRCSRVDQNGETVTQVCCKNCRGRWMYMCSRMNWLARCKVCGCGRSTHEWITTMTEIVEVQKEDESLIREILDSDSALKKINTAISEFEDRVTKCKDETRQMLGICAKLNGFVRSNVLFATVNDASGITGDTLSRSLQNRILIKEKQKAKQM